MREFIWVREGLIFKLKGLNTDWFFALRKQFSNFFYNLSEERNRALPFWSSVKKLTRLFSQVARPFGASGWEHAPVQRHREKRSGRIGNTKKSTAHQVGVPCFFLMNTRIKKRKPKLSLVASSNFDSDVTRVSHFLPWEKLSEMYGLTSGSEQLRKRHGQASWRIIQTETNNRRSRRKEGDSKYTNIVRNEKHIYLQTTSVEGSRRSFPKPELGEDKS